MKRLLLVLCATLPLAACATYGPPGPAIAYDGYYDDYYGPIHDGYWGEGDVFYYRSGDHGRFRADRDHHFRRDTGGDNGGRFHAVHGMGPGDGHHHG